MERMLVPYKLTSEPNQPNSFNLYSYWKQTLGNFFRWIGTEDRYVTESYNLNCIVKYVKEDVYDNISVFNTNDEAIKHLDSH